MALRQSKALLERLGSPRAEVSESARGEVLNLPVEQFLRLQKAHNQRGIRFAGATAVVIAASFLVAAALFGAAFDGRLPDQGLIESLTMMPALGLFGLILIISPAAYFAARWRRHHVAGKRLFRLRSERIEQGGDFGFQQLTLALDTLHKVLALEHPDLPAFGDVFRGYREMMLRELPAITCDQAILLSENQRSVLRSLIGSSSVPFDYRNTEIGLAALGALAKADDAHTFELVQRLAGEPPITANMKRVRLAATEHLQSMRERRAENEREATLLRASAVPTEPDLLLRAAQSPGSTPENQLLRPK